MRKKIICYIALAAALLLGLTACTQELRIDRYELAVRLEKAGKAYSFAPEDVLIEQNKQLIFYSLQQQDDCILTLVTDKTDRIQTLSVTIDRAKWSVEAIQSVFVPFSKAVLTAFCANDTIAQKAAEELELNNANTYISDRLESAAIEKFTFTVYTNALSNVIACDYGAESVSTTA
ncbi:MAG: hypothetical protein LBS36_04395 [Oscillospiraceae bacterium]|jgi:hypothetical protein|nr:hypothetical protein [Oscillospiraceae bacterium]